MNKSRKVLLISLLPVFLTLLFIAYILVPSIQEMAQTYQKLNDEKKSYNEKQSQLSLLRQDQELTKKIQDLNNELSDFNYRFPPENDLTVFLVDLEKYAQSYNVKVISLSSDEEKSVEIIDPKKIALEEKKKKKRFDTKEEELPITLSEIPLSINVSGYFPDVVKFVNFLEKYQRQVAIDGIKISGAKDVKNEVQSVKPQLEMEIKAKVYTVVEVAEPHPYCH